MLYVKTGTKINFADRTWVAQEPALSRYLDLQGSSVLVSEPTPDLKPIERVFADATADGNLTIRAVATVKGETSDGGGEGDVGVPGALLGTAVVAASDVYDG